jgi:hypothetical protein
MPITLNGDTGITTPSYGGADVAEYLVPVTAFKNRIINGAMQIDQRSSAGTPVNNGAASNTYFVDRWHMFGSVAARMNGRQSTVAPTGFINSALITSSAATTAGAGDAYGVRQYIEGLNMSDFGWGTAAAQTVTVSFWVRSSITGVYAFAFFNSDNTRSYVATYNISSANTWEQKSITIAGDTSGTWLTTNGIGTSCWWDLGSGSSFTAIAGAWNASLQVKTSGSVNLVGTSGATFYITGVQLEKGSTATSFDYRPYTNELALCQRYYQRGTKFTNGYGDTTNVLTAGLQLPVEMRAQPSLLNAVDSNGIVANGSLYNLTANSASIANFWFSGSSLAINVTTNSQITRWTAAYGRINDLQLSAEL